MSERNAVTKALMVLVLTPHIRAYLERTDPMSLKQASDALVEIGEDPSPDTDAPQPGDDLCDTCGSSGVAVYETDAEGNTMCSACAKSYHEGDGPPYDAATATGMYDRD